MWEFRPHKIPTVNFATNFFKLKSRGYNSEQEADGLLAEQRKSSGNNGILFQRCWKIGMSNLIKSLLIIILITLLQLAIYALFFKPIITTWGASKQEVAMTMAGDNPALTITSTRAILINAPKSEVWQWLIQLGADRGGFYSYTFIEEAMGYKTRPQTSTKPEFKTIAVGDVVRGSIDENSSIIPYNFPVLYVKPEDTFVLENWGTFLLESMNNHQTRLIIRTQEHESSNYWLRAGQYVGVPLHFIMERRTLMGIKARVENVQLSPSTDIAWFAGIVLSALLIYVLIFIGRGLIQSIIIPAIFSVSWLCTLLLLNPTPVHSIGLLVVMCVYIFIRKINRE